MCELTKYNSYNHAMPTTRPVARRTPGAVPAGDRTLKKREPGSAFTFFPDYMVNLLVDHLTERRMIDAFTLQPTVHGHRSAMSEQHLQLFNGHQVSKLLAALAQLKGTAENLRRKVAFGLIDRGRQHTGAAPNPLRRSRRRSAHRMTARPPAPGTRPARGTCRRPGRRRSTPPPAYRR